MSRAVISGAVALTIALAAVGCGGSARPTPQFTRIAGTICRDADIAIEALPARGRSLRALALTARRELPIVRREVAQLSGLTAPASKAAEFATALASTRRETTIVADLVTALRERRPSRVATLALAGSSADLRAKTAMTALGLTDCAREAQPRRR
jgi:hypothetical protein